MEWYEKLAWYTALGFITFHSFKIMAEVRNHIDEENNLNNR